MSGIDVTTLKREVGQLIDMAIADNGGAARVRAAFKLMPSMLDYLAGWVMARYALRVDGATLDRWTASGPDQWIVRRVYDLVRLRLETESSTS